jgi:uncharacterized protein (TIGR02453 family)
MNDTFRGFGRGALTFLRQLKRHNEREWFLAHKETFDNEVLAPLKLLVEEVDVRFGSFAPEFVGDPKRSIFRIYRDVRFSKDKSPYKTHAASWFKHQNSSHGVGSYAFGAGAGFYFHLAPAASFVGGGIWMPPRPTLNQLRDSIAAKPKEFEQSMSAPAFKRRFGKLSEESMLTRLPRGFAPGHAAEKWLRYQSFTAGAELSDADILDRKLVDKIEKDFKTMLPFVRWLNQALGYRARERR